MVFGAPIEREKHRDNRSSGQKRADEKNWESAVYMAYGVTTTLDNSMWSQNVFPTAQMVEAGMGIGPRTYSTGDPLYNGDAARQNDLTTLAVTEQNVKRLQSWGAVTMKQYSQPRRDQRQWVSDAARRFGLRVTAEGGDIEYNLSMIMDGQTGWEHPIGNVPLYGDVTKFFGMANAFYSPTFLVGGASSWNEEYWYAESDVFKDPNLQSWLPWQMLIPSTRRRMLRPATDYSFQLIARSLADIVAKVVRDRMMIDLDARLPGYDFAVHKGYATKLHQQRLEALGPCPEHRLTYANVRRAARVLTS